MFDIFIENINFINNVNVKIKLIKIISILTSRMYLLSPAPGQINGFSFKPL